MMKNRFLSTVGKIVLGLALGLTFIQCSEDEVLKQEETSPVQESADTAVPSNVLSFTMSAIYTNISEDEVNCATCTYVVTEGTTVVDGEALDIKPGSVICLDKAIKYGSLEFLNLVGTEEEPITIGFCAK